MTEFDLWMVADPLPPGGAGARPFLWAAGRLRLRPECPPLPELEELRTEGALCCEMLSSDAVRRKVKLVVSIMNAWSASLKPAGYLDPKCVVVACGCWDEEGLWWSFEWRCIRL